MPVERYQVLAWSRSGPGALMLHIPHHCARLMQKLGLDEDTLRLMFDGQRVRKEASRSRDEATVLRALRGAFNAAAARYRLPPRYSLSPAATKAHSHLKMEHWLNAMLAVI